MDVGYRSPLFDLFRRGEVEKEIRLVAARGALAPLPQEQLALIAWLVDDADADVRSAAEATIARIPPAALAAFLAQPEVVPTLRGFYRSRLSDPAAQTSGSPATAAAGARAPSEDPGAAAVPLFEKEPSSIEPRPAERASGEVFGAAQRIAAMAVADRIKVAMLGTREERAILVRDPNKLVASAVLSSPKLSESEVETIARMTNVAEEVLRAIGSSRHWLKNYGVVSGLVRNPKTPVGVSMSLLNRLLERDLKMLSVDRNVPEALRLLARKLLVNADARKR